jgi:Zn-dependent protease with chaperone function/tetratricopeptide (TPR) repeat protein
VSVIAGDYFDGRTSVRHAVTAFISGGKLKIVGRDVNQEFDLRRVRRSLRVADTPRWLYLGGGGAFVTADNDAIDRISRKRRYDRLLHRWESRPAYAALALGLVVAALWFSFDRGVPLAVDHIAERIPVAAEATLGEQTLRGLDQRFMQPSKLSPERQEALRAKFSAMTKAAGDATPYRLEFRESKFIGANAFALPSGIIVMTDELVRLARHDEEVLAVLGHELGHVRHRHTMRRLLEASATGLIIAAVTGDVASATSIAAAAPAVLVQSKYSRDNEREADAYSLELLGKAGISPKYMATMLGRLEAKSRGRRGRGIPDFLSSHPATQERQALALAAAGSDVADEAAPADAPPEKLPRLPADAVQRQVVELLRQRDYDALGRLLDARQAAFEQDSTASAALERTYGAFERLAKSDEPAISEWVARMPRSYSARAARAEYLLWQGIKARGTDFAADTPEDSIDAMRAFLERSLADASASLPMTAKPYISRRVLLSLAQYTGRRDVAEENYREALKLAPHSVDTRLAYMTVLEPRWGGSQAQMEKFAEEARSALAPADAAKIAARIPAYRGFESHRARDYERAVEEYNRALALDADDFYLCGRAYALAELKRDEEALADLDRLMKAGEPHCVALAPSVAARAKDAEAAVRVLGRVIELRPEYPNAYSQRGWRYQQQNRLDLAFPDYLAAAKLGDPWAELQAGKFLWNGWGVKADRDEGLAWLRKAAAHGDRDAKVSLEQALAELARK